MRWENGVFLMAQFGIGFSYKVVPPFDSVQLVYNSHFTMVFVGDISIVNGIINQLSSLGGHHLVSHMLHGAEILTCITGQNIWGK